MKFEIRRTRNKQFRAYILGRNGRTLFVSEPYKRRAGAFNAIRVVRLHAAATYLTVDRSKR